MVTIYENSDEKEGTNIDNRDEEINKAGLIESQDIEREKEVATQNIDGEFSDWIINFLYSYDKNLPEKEEKNEQSVQVSEVLGGVARIYERIRTTVEYKGEHVLRRNAIERILKRLIWEQKSIKVNIDNKKVSESLIRELIWARYLPNGKIPKSKTQILEKVIDKYVYFLKNLDTLPSGISSIKVRDWIWGVASSEIEDLLDPSFRDLYVNLMSEWFKNSFVWKDKTLDEKNKNIQIYLAVHRAFTKSDEPIMRYHLLLRGYKNWKNADRSEINKIILQFPKIYTEIESYLNYSGRYALYRKVQKQAVVFEVFKDIAEEEKYNLFDLLEDRTMFENKIRDVCEYKYAQVKQKVSTGIVRSILYIFVTKVIFAMGIEIPYEIFMYGQLRYLPLTINMIIPPLMMGIIGLSIKVPGAKNTQAIVRKLESVIYQDEVAPKDTFSVQKPSKNSPILSLFALLYAVVIFLVFGAITYGLNLLNYSLFGILIFFIFLSLVMLFAYRIRFNANQMKIESEKENFITHITSYITLPFLNVGFYLSRGFAKINFLTVILDFLIEVPLKNIIEIFEEWSKFIREKKEEVVEMPE